MHVAQGRADRPSKGKGEGASVGGVGGVWSVATPRITNRCRSEREWAFLAESGRALLSSTDYRETLRIAARLGLSLADGCSVDLLGPFGWLRALPDGVFPFEPEPFPAKAALENRRAMLVAEVSDPRQVLALPLGARERYIGVLTLTFHGDRVDLDMERFRVAEEFAGVVAIALDNANRHLQELRSRDETLARIAHDLRSALNVVFIGVQLVEREKGACGPVRQIHNGVARMRRLVDDLTDVSSIETGHARIEPQQVDVVELLALAVEQSRGKAEERSVSLHLDLPAASVIAHADCDRVLQVLGNLVDNAVRFTPSGGQIRIGARPGVGEVELVVEDDGPGIEAADRARIFEPFWRRGSRRSGSGLGLAICRGLIEAHGGRIWATGSQSGGAAIHFTLPSRPRRPSC